MVPTYYIYVSVQVSPEFSNLSAKYQTSFLQREEDAGMVGARTLCKTQSDDVKLRGQALRRFFLDGSAEIHARPPGQWL